MSSLVNAALSRVGVKLVPARAETRSPPGNVYPLGADETCEFDLETRKVLNLLAYTKNNDTVYNAREFDSAYHSVELGGHRFRGQRDPVQRLEGVPFDFDGATVLDLGCNQGGMLAAIAARIRTGVGLDYDPKMINAANRIRAYKALDNLGFYVFDLEKENLELLPNFIPGERADIVFLLSVCMWIANWKAVVDAARSLADCLLFESNGSNQQQAEQQAYLHSVYASVAVVRERSTDDSGQKRRRLLFCRVATAHPNDPARPIQPAAKVK